MNTDSFSQVRSAKMAEIQHIHPIRDQEQASGKPQDINFSQILGTVWRGKWWLFLSMMITVSLAVIWLTQVAVPLYTATSVVMLQNRNEQVVDFESVLSGIGSDQNSVNTEVEVFKARGLVERLVEQLGLEKDPEFNETLRLEHPWQLSVLIRDAKKALGLYTPAPPPSARKIRDDTIDEVLNALTINNVRRSFVFRITAATEEPEKSTLIADKLANLYINDQIDAKFTANERATTWLAEQIGELEVELETSENAVKAFDASSNLISPETLTLRSRQLKDFRDRQSALTAQSDILARRLEKMLQAREADDPVLLIQLTQDEQLGRLFNALTSGGAGSQRAFEARLQVLIQDLQIELSRIGEQIRILQTSITTLEAEVGAQSEELIKLNQLERVANANRLVYEYFLSRQKEISAQRGVQQADSRLLSRAVVPDSPASPRKALVVVLAAILGILIGVVLLVIRELRNSAFRTSEDLEAATGVPVMGEITSAPTTNRRRLLKLLATKPNSALVEAIRNLRTTILLSQMDEPPQVIMLTSSVPGEGKTTQSLGLSQNLASMGKKVLMIEGDIRRQTLREYFSTDHTRGLLSAVTHPEDVSDIIFHSDILGVDVILGEGSKTNAADFFGAAPFRDFLERMRDRYDFIIIDTPPVLAVPDARVIAKVADLSLFVVHWNTTPRWQVRKGLHAFQMINAPINGLVLSQVNQRSMRQYGYVSDTKGYYS